MAQATSDPGRRVLITGGGRVLRINPNRHPVERAMCGVDYVVHGAAALPLYSEEDIYTTDVVGTQNILMAAERHGVERVVHVSSTAVYGIPDHHPLVEEDRLEGVGPYGQAKIQAEMICLEY